MNQVDKQKYQVAWFNLSEFVRRGEKERALGIYKLLMHTIDDTAFAKQLEGDLLLFFDDIGAPNSYVAAAQLYKKNNKLAQATAIYEHLVAQFPHRTDFLNTLISYYIELNHPTRILLSLTRLLPVIVPAQPAAIISKALENTSIILEQHEQAKLYSQFIFLLIKYEKDEPEIIDSLIKKTLELLNPTEQKDFLNQLKKTHH